MDVDALTAVHGPMWARLEELCSQRRLTRAESDELLDLYQRTTTHLSLVRSSSPDPYLVPYLSWLVTRARTRAYRAGGRRAPVAGLVEFFGRTFPAAVYRMRWWWGTAAVLGLALAVVMGWWLMQHPAFTRTLIDDEAARRIVDEKFEGYYSEYAASSFGFKVFTNNAWVGAQAVVLGVLGLPVVYVVFGNMLNLAVMGSLMIRAGRGGLFFGLILPHGLIELTAVFVASGVGLRLFWSWVCPGDRSRASALGAQARASVGVVLGLVAVFAVAGVIEAFVTPSPLPTAARVGIGVVVELCFLTYVFVVGRRAARDGVTGDVTGAAVVAELPSRG